MCKRSILMLAGLAVTSAAFGLAVALADGSGSCANAQGSGCVSACRAAHNDCRIRTKGSGSCDAELRACMQGCLKH